MGRRTGPPWKASGSPAAILDVSGPDSSKPGSGPGHWEASPPRSLLKQEPETPDRGMSRASLLPAAAPRALRSELSGSSLPAPPARVPEPVAAAGALRVERAARRFSSCRGDAVAQLLDRQTPLGPRPRAGRGDRGAGGDSRGKGGGGEVAPGPTHLPSNSAAAGR